MLCMDMVIRNWKGDNLMKKTKYKEYRIGEHLFLLKLTYLPTGGLSYNSVVKVHVMKHHMIPKTFFQKMFEQSIECFVWDPLFTEDSLETFCIGKCAKIAHKYDRLNQAEIEWGRI